MKVLFVGNSYTYYNEMPKIFENLANRNRKEVQVFSVTKGGRRLSAYSDQEDQTTKELAQLLSQHHFDICVLQEQSILPLTDYSCFLSGLDCVLKMVGTHADKRLLYATWGRKAGSHTLEENGWTTASMAQCLSRAYHKAAEAVDADVSDVGLCFLDVYRNHGEIELYNPDLSHPSYEGSCLAALTHYYTLFREFPENTGSLELKQEVLAVFKKCITKTEC